MPAEVIDFEEYRRRNWPGKECSVSFWINGRWVRMDEIETEEDLRLLIDLIEK